MVFNSGLFAKQIKKIKRTRSVERLDAEEPGEAPERLVGWAGAGCPARPQWFS